MRSVDGVSEPPRRKDVGWQGRVEKCTFPHIAMAPSAANKDEAARCLKIASKYLQVGSRVRGAAVANRAKDGA